MKSVEREAVFDGARLATDSVTPDNALFIVVSFEGTDPYSQAGGLGVRVAGLVETLADTGYDTHLFFVGDPALPGEETTRDGKLTLHRWSQWISANCPGGVYDGEGGKVDDVSASMPSYLIERVVAPAIAAGRIPIILFEEWQTAECACRVAEGLVALGLRRHAVLVWNANNPYGFERIDWLRLAAATMITTISRHMRSIIRACGVDARVIPNGIPDASFDAPTPAKIAHIRRAFDTPRASGFLFKMARWEREKGWSQALDAVAHARAASAADPSGSTRSPILVARSGGPTGTGVGLANDAESRGLRVVSFNDEQEFMNGLAEGVRSGADVISLRFGVSPLLARALYAASDGVLANSVSEPFGLVGLEAMAAGGLAFTGGTGEDYAIGGRNAVVLETLDPAEIVARWAELDESPQLAARLRRAARRTARDYTWRSISQILLGVVTYQARAQGLVAFPSPRLPREAPADMVPFPAPVRARGSLAWPRSERASGRELMTTR
jgi:glycosyltransferase involved in cell wall biosynthesis